MKKVPVSFTLDRSDRQALEILAKQEKITLSGLVSELVIRGLKQKLIDTEIGKMQTDINARLDDMSESLKWLKAWGMTQKSQAEKEDSETIDEAFEQYYRNQ